MTQVRFNSHNCMQPGLRWIGFIITKLQESLGQLPQTGGDEPVRPLCRPIRGPRSAGTPGALVRPSHEPRKERTLADAEELALIARIRAREPSALTTIFERYGTAMTTLAASMLRDRTEADDVVEDALLRIHAAGAQFRGERGLRTWVLRIAANLCRDRLRRRKFTAPLPQHDEDPFAAAGLTFDPSVAMDEALDGQVLMAALERAIAALPQDQREAVVMRHRLGLSYTEMTDMLGVPEGTVKSRLARALTTLRTAMEEFQ